MKVTSYGHSCFAVEVSGKTLLFDPFITPNPLAKSVDAAALAPDVILVTHAHFDHVADAVDIAKRTGALVISNYEICEWFGRQGVTNVHAMNHGGGYDFDFGRVKYTTAIHTSSFADGTYGGAPGGFVIKSKDGVFYYSGDTALTLDMKLIEEEFALNFAVLPIGDNFTMGAADAARAAGFIGCSEVLGVHYDTFPPIVIDPDAARQTFKSAGCTLHLLEIGASHDF